MQKCSLTTLQTRSEKINKQGFPLGENLLKNIIMEVKVQQNVITDMRKRMRDISLSVSWREIANTYFNKSSSWFYHKLDGIDGNGGVGGFTPEESETLYGALNDLADRLRRAAENIKAPASVAPFN